MEDDGTYLYEVVKEKANNLHDDVLYDGSKCRGCEYRTGLDSDGLFECVVPDAIKCPHVYSALDNLISYLEVAMQEKTL